MGKKYTEAQKKATLNYLDKLKRLVIRVKPEEYEKYKMASEIKGYKTITPFIKDEMGKTIDKILEEPK